MRKIKVYLLETNAYNEVVFVRGRKAKIIDSAPSGKFDGVVDLYSRNTVPELRRYCKSTLFNYYDEIEGDEFNFADIAEDPSVELTFVCEYYE